MRPLLGDSLHALRLLPAISAAIKIALTGLIAIEFGADLYGIAFACLCVLAAPVYLVIDNQFAANTFEPVFWMGCAYVLILAIKNERPRLLMWFGLLAGIGIENKLSMIFFCAAIFIGVLLTPARKLLRSPLGLARDAHRGDVLSADADVAIPPRVADVANARQRSAHAQERGGISAGFHGAPVDDAGAAVGTGLDCRDCASCSREDAMAGVRIRLPGAARRS